jgi:uncharacterized damage-inducible protein DinB
MTTPAEIALLATYNQLMNTRLYAAAATLSADELQADRKAFFGSIVGTCNHLIVTDTLWLKRFINHPLGFASLAPIEALPAPKTLTEIVFSDIVELSARRRMLDQVILQWSAELTDAHLQTVLHYHNVKGIPAQKRFSSLLLHFFNHQTHHRGQIGTLLFQAGADPGVTDLLPLIPDETDD